MLDRIFKCPGLSRAFVFPLQVFGGPPSRVSRSATVRHPRFNTRHADGTKRRRIAANRPCRRGECSSLCVRIPADTKGGGRPPCPGSVNGAEELTSRIETIGTRQRGAIGATVRRRPLPLPAGSPHKRSECRPRHKRQNPDLTPLIRLHRPRCPGLAGGTIPRYIFL